MKNNTTNWGYLLLVFVAGLVMFFWSLGQPFPISEHQRLFVFCFVTALFLENTSPLLPHFGSLSAASALYVFLTLTLGVQAGILTALLATGSRVLWRDRGPWQLRLFSPFQRLLAIGIAGASLPYLTAREFPHIGALKVCVVAALFFTLDAFMEGTAVGLTLFTEEQLDWYKTRYRAMPVSLVLVLLGGIAALVYKNDPILAVICLVCVLALQFVMRGLSRGESLDVSTRVALENLGTTQLKLKQMELVSEELHHHADQRAFELSTLLEFGRAMGTTLTLDHAFAVVLNILNKLFRYQSCILFLTETNEGDTHFHAARIHSPYVEFCRKLHIRSGETIVGACARDARPYLVDSFKRKDPPLLLENERSEMAVPLTVDQRVSGVLYVGSSEEKGFSEDDLRLLGIIAQQLAIVVSYAESYENKAQMAVTDGLTGLYTHRYFQERLTEEVRRSERYHQALSLIMLDLDNFKRYNDTNGHSEGDALLRLACDVLRDCTRDTDVICRYGGDEFAILLLETTKETALSIAMRIRETVELRLNVNTTVKITASLGVASFPEDASNRVDLFAEADKALYESKRGGRNRVIAATRKTA